MFQSLPATCKCKLNLTKLSTNLKEKKAVFFFGLPSLPLTDFITLVVFPATESCEANETSKSTAPVGHGCPVSVLTGL